jgi:uncharacterized membrane protein YbhN (UPF0104 family)
MNSDLNEQSGVNEIKISTEAVSISKSGSHKLFTYLSPIIKIGLLGLVFFYIFRYLYSNWGQLSSLNIRLNYGYVLLSFIIMKLAWMSTAWSWGKTLEAFGYKIPYSDVYVIYFRSMVAKYLPGKVWQIAGSTYVAAQKGVPEGATIASVVIGQAYSVLSGVALVVAAVAFGLIDKTGGLPFLRWTSVPMLIILIILVFKPDLSVRLMNLVLPLFKRKKVEATVSISTSLWLFLLYLIPWLIFGLSFWFLANALTPISLSEYIPLTAILVSGTVVGFLALFAPGGIGVKEATMAAMAGSMTSLPISFALALGLAYRIVTSAAELLAFGLTWIISKPSDRPNRR